MVLVGVAAVELAGPTRRPLGEEANDNVLLGPAKLVDVADGKTKSVDVTGTMVEDATELAVVGKAVE